LGDINSALTSVYVPAELEVPIQLTMQINAVCGPGYGCRGTTSLALISITDITGGPILYDVLPATDTPEPSSMALACVGFLAFCLRSFLRSLREIR